MTIEVGILSAFTLIIGLAWVLALRSVRNTKSNKMIASIVSDKSHEVKNRVMEVRAGLRQISRSPDPMKALIDAMTGRGHDDKWR